MKRPSGGVTHSLQQVDKARLAVAYETDVAMKGSGLPEPEPAVPLDMEALNRMFSAVAHLQTR